ncbi:MAG: sigma 54-interacting transcriptional regulator, partial [Candidatus Binatia bacterium]
MEKPQIILVHSLSFPLAPVQKLLEGRGFTIHLSRSWEEAEMVCSLFPLDQIQYIFADVTLCHGNGWERFLHRAKFAPSGTPVICFHPELPDGLYSLIDHTATAPDQKQAGENISTPLIIGETPKFQKVLDLASRYAQHDITVLITGETGTGKEVIARYLHAHSSRRDNPLVACNVTSIPETLVESEL